MSKADILASLVSAGSALADGTITASELGLATVATSGSYADLINIPTTIDNTAIGGTTPAAATFTTLTATGQANLGGDASLPALQVSATSGITRYCVLSGSAAGGVTLQAQASGGNPGFTFISRAAGVHSFASNGTASTVQFQVSHTASAVNYVQVTGSATGAGASNLGGLLYTGSDSSPSMAITTKGSGYIAFAGGASTANQALRIITTNAVGTGNLIAVQGAAAGSAPSIQAISGASGTDANIDLALTPKGTGLVKSNSGIQVNTNQVINTFTANTTATTPNQVLTALDATIYRSVKFLVQAVDAAGTKYHTTEIIAIHNGSTASSTEYASVNIGGICATFDVDYSTGTLRLLTTPSSANSTVFTVAVQLLK